jgi:hypothetical protein
MTSPLSEKARPGAVAGSANARVGWFSLAIRAITGLVLGIWSFRGPVPVPDWIGRYDALPRRLLRLGHIAFFGLGILNIRFAAHLDRPRAAAFPRALGAMTFGNVALPLTLIGAAVFEPAKHLMAVAALPVAYALVVEARVALADSRGDLR